MDQGRKWVIAAMRWAQHEGVDPRNSAPQQAKRYETLVRMNIARVKSEYAANRMLRSK